MLFDMANLCDTHPLDAMLLADVMAPALVSRNAPPTETDDGDYLLTVAAPGVATKDVAVTVEDGNVLNVHGETVRGAHTHCVHWATTLPADACAEQATVAHLDGVLTVTIPRAEPAKVEPSRIVVSTEATPTDDAD